MDTKMKKLLLSLLIVNGHTLHMFSADNNNNNALPFNELLEAIRIQEEQNDAMPALIALTPTPLIAIAHSLANTHRSLTPSNSIISQPVTQPVTHAFRTNNKNTQEFNNYDNDDELFINDAEDAQTTDTEEEDYEGHATDIATAFSIRTGQVTLLQMDGPLTREELKKALELAKKGCEDIKKIQTAALKIKYGDSK